MCFQQRQHSPLFKVFFSLPLPFIPCWETNKGRCLFVVDSFFGCLNNLCVNHICPKFVCVFAWPQKQSKSTNKERRDTQKEFISKVSEISVPIQGWDCNLFVIQLRMKVGGILEGGLCNITLRSEPRLTIEFGNVESEQKVIVTVFAFKNKESKHVPYDLWMSLEHKQQYTSVTQPVKCMCNSLVES